MDRKRPQKTGLYRSSPVFLSSRMEVDRSRSRSCLFRQKNRTGPDFQTLGPRQSMQANVGISHPAQTHDSERRPTPPSRGPRQRTQADTGPPHSAQAQPRPVFDTPSRVCTPGALVNFLQKRTYEQSYVRFLFYIHFLGAETRTSNCRRVIIIFSSFIFLFHLQCEYEHIFISFLLY